jgi:hypothetical protein
MDPTAYTKASNRAAERYSIVLAAFRSLLFGHMGRPFSEVSMRTLRAEASSIARTFADSETDLIRTTLSDTAQNAQEAVLGDLDAVSGATIPEALKPFLEQSVEHLSLEIAAQLSRDVEALVRRYREYALEAQLAAYSRGLIKPAVTMGDQQVSFHFRDRAGRLTPSEGFIRIAWRQSLVSLGAEFYLLEAVNRSATKVIVVNPDPSHKWQGQEISLTGEEGRSFTDLRDEIFHPNTDSVLKASI